MSKEILSEEDKALFREVTALVTPLRKDPQKQTKKNAAGECVNNTPIPKKKQLLSSQEAAPAIYLSDYYSEEVSAEALLSYCQHSIPKKRMAELQRGKILYDRRLDLHGLRPEQASKTLLSCIEEAYQQGQRALLVIHGKGNRLSEQGPVLKNLVNQWLRQIPYVLAFHSALPKDGGTGALYVLLKREKGSAP